MKAAMAPIFWRSFRRVRGKRERIAQPDRDLNERISASVRDMPPARKISVSFILTQQGKAYSASEFETSPR
jgi:hypothetical protein